MNLRSLFAAIILSATTINTFAFDEFFPLAATQPGRPPEVQIVPFNESEYLAGQSWLNNFENVIVINKAAKGSTAQSLRLYSNQELLMNTKVSTGREQWEKKRKTWFHHGPRNGYWSVTYTGYYSPEFLSKDHYSKLWRTRMPWAVFFNDGIAVHQAPNGTEPKLGQRASGGCVRTSAQSAEYIFKKVEASGKGLVPSFTVNGETVLDESGAIKAKSSYKTIFIVENIEE